MTERTIVLDHLKFNYEGVFNLPELYNLIAGFFYEKGYDWGEKINEELVTPEGKQIRWVLEPWKNVSDFYQIIAHVKVHCSDVKEVEVEHEGRTIRLNQGVIYITFDGFVKSDRHGKWESKPLYWLLNILAQKYFYKEHFAKNEDWIKSDIDDLLNKIKTYLNVFKYTYQV